MIDKVGERLANWKRRALSFAGRSVLIKAVLQSIPTYAMQTYLLPSYVCTEIDAKIRNFWWGHDEQPGHHLYLKAWTSICTPKEAGGLGFRGTRDTNEVFITKLIWQLNTTKDKLWVKVLRSKYLRGLNFLDENLRSDQPSWIWSSILKCREAFLKGACYTVK